MFLAHSFFRDVCFELNFSTIIAIFVFNPFLDVEGEFYLTGINSFLFHPSSLFFPSSFLYSFLSPASLFIRLFYFLSNRGIKKHCSFWFSVIKVYFSLLLSSFFLILFYFLFFWCAFLILFLDFFIEFPRSNWKKFMFFERVRHKPFTF